MKKNKYVVLFLAFLGIPSLCTGSLYELNAGKNLTVILGETITLNGMIGKGNINNIQEYRWEEFGKVLTDNEGDKIVYWAVQDSQYGYKFTQKGTHVLTFKVIDDTGVQYEDTLRIKVKENSVYNLELGKDKILYLGESIRLSAKVLNKDKSNIEEYHWEENGRILKNMLNDDILYVDEVNRENDYMPISLGQHNLTFVVTDKQGNQTKKTQIVMVKKSNKGLKLDAGKIKKITLGDVVKLEGTVIQGNKDNVQYYRWEEYGKVLKNIVGDEIIYYDYYNKENDYKPTTVGEHRLDFIAKGINGKIYKERLLLLVKEDINSKPFELDVGCKELIMSLGETLNLSGKVIGDKSKVKFYRWRIGHYDRPSYSIRYHDFVDLNGKKAIYVDEEDRFFEFKATDLGYTYLKFDVITTSGRVISMRKNIFLEIDEKKSNKKTARGMYNLTKS